MSKIRKPRQDDLQQEHDAQRGAAARDAYIRWKMQDVPSIYCALMPPTYNARILRMAEESIRHQLRQDQKLLESPWCKIGPACGLLDYSDMSQEERDSFILEITIPKGMPDRPKPGCENHPDVLVASKRAALPPYLRTAARRAELMEKYEKTMDYEEKKAIAEELERMSQEGE